MANENLAVEASANTKEKDTVNDDDGVRPEKAEERKDIHHLSKSKEETFKEEEHDLVDEKLDVEGTEDKVSDFIANEIRGESSNKTGETTSKENEISKITVNVTDDKGKGDGDLTEMNKTKIDVADEIPSSNSVNNEGDCLDKEGENTEKRGDSVDKVGTLDKDGNDMDKGNMDNVEDGSGLKQDIQCKDNVNTIENEFVVEGKDDEGETVTRNDAKDKIAEKNVDGAGKQMPQCDKRNQNTELVDDNERGISGEDSQENDVKENVLVGEKKRKENKLMGGEDEKSNVAAKSSSQIHHPCDDKVNTDHNGSIENIDDLVHEILSTTDDINLISKNEQGNVQIMDENPGKDEAENHVVMDGEYCEKGASTKSEVASENFEKNIGSRKQNEAKDFEIAGAFKKDKNESLEVNTSEALRQTKDVSQRNDESPDTTDNGNKVSNGEGQLDPSNEEDKSINDGKVDPCNKEDSKTIGEGLDADRDGGEGLVPSHALESRKASSNENDHSHPDVDVDRHQGNNEAKVETVAETTRDDGVEYTKFSDHVGSTANETERKRTKRSDSDSTVYQVQTDYLTRQVLAKQEKEIYLEEKLAETNRDLEIAERKVKDLQLRLKRFAKDDEAKDQKMRQMEEEYKDLSNQMQRIEETLDSKVKNNNNKSENVVVRQRNKSASSVCVVL